MVKNRTPTMKLSTMRAIYGSMAVVFLLLAPLTLLLGDNTFLGIVQVAIAGVATWFAISPPAYVRRNFIQ